MKNKDFYDMLETWVAINFDGLLKPIYITSPGVFILSEKTD